MECEGAAILKLSVGVGRIHSIARAKIPNPRLVGRFAASKSQLSSIEITTAGLRSPRSRSRRNQFLH